MQSLRRKSRTYRVPVHPTPSGKKGRTVARNNRVKSRKNGTMKIKGYFGTGGYFNNMVKKIKESF